MKKININGVLYEAITPQEYFNNPNVDSQTAIIGNDGCVYPCKMGSNMIATGAYARNKNMIRFNPPEESAKDEYSVSKILDFDDVSNVSELIEKNNVYKDMEREILTSPDNIFTPNPREGDGPEVVAMKEAVIAKNIDFNKYRPRFGNDFNNARRLFENSRISLSKIVMLGDNLDMSVELVIKDKNPNVPNPIGKEIRVELTNTNIEE